MPLVCALLIRIASRPVCFSSLLQVRQPWHDRHRDSGPLRVAGRSSKLGQQLSSELCLFCDHTCPIQNTKPLRTPKYTKYTPNPPPKPKYRKNTKNIRNWVIFVYFSYFFCISVLEGIWGVFRGVFWGSEGFCILYGARMIAMLICFWTCFPPKLQVTVTYKHLSQNLHDRYSFVIVELHAKCFGVIVLEISLQFHKIEFWNYFRNKFVPEYKLSPRFGLRIPELPASCSSAEGRGSLAPCRSTIR